MLRDEPREWIGIANRHVWFTLRDRGWTGNLWAKRCKVIPINDRRHPLKALQSIKRQADQGAWIWQRVP